MTTLAEAISEYMQRLGQEMRFAPSDEPPGRKDWRHRLKRLNVPTPFCYGTKNPQRKKCLHKNPPQQQPETDAGKPTDPDHEYAEMLRCLEAGDVTQANVHQRQVIGWHMAGREFQGTTREAVWRNVERVLELEVEDKLLEREVEKERVKVAAELEVEAKDKLLGAWWRGGLREGVEAEKRTVGIHDNWQFAKSLVAAGWQPFSTVVGTTGWYLCRRPWHSWIEYDGHGWTRPNLANEFWDALRLSNRQWLPDHIVRELDAYLSGTLSGASLAPDMDALGDKLEAYENHLALRTERIVRRRLQLIRHRQLKARRARG